MVPQELRDIIYGYIFTIDPDSRGLVRLRFRGKAPLLGQKKKLQPIYSMLAFLQTYRQANEEARKYFYTLNDFGVFGDDVVRKHNSPMGTRPCQSSVELFVEDVGEARLSTSSA